MRRPYWILLGLVGVLFLGPSVSQSQTLERWLKEAPSDQHLHFTPYTAYDLTTNSLGVPEPTQQLFGHLSFSNISDNAYPLQVTFFIYHHPLEISQPAVALNVKEFHWGDRLAKTPESDALGSLVLTRTEMVSLADRAVPVAVWSEKLLSGIGAGFNQSYSTLLAELRSANGDLLERKLLIEKWNTSYGRVQNQAISLGDPEADRYFQQRNVLVTHAKFLSPDLRAYDRVKGIWLDRAALNDPHLDDSFYRRLLVSGVYLTGRSDSLRALQQRLGLTAPTSILDGAIVDSSGTPVNAPIFNQYASYGAMGMNPAVVGQMPKLDDFMPIAMDRFKALQKATLAFLGGFIFFEAVFIAWGFMKWGPDRRVRLWVWVPLSSIVWTLVGWMGAPLILPLQPAVQVTQAEYAYAGWPESLVETNFEVLGFGRTTFTWDLPPSSELADTAMGYTAQMNKHLSSAALILKPEHSTLTLSGHRGGILTAATRAWVPTRPACRWTADHNLEILEEFEKAWMYDGHTWKDLGPVSRGDHRDVRVAPAVFKNLMNSVLPSRLANILGGVGVSSTIGPQNVFLGWRHGAPAVRPQWIAKDRAQSRRITIYGFPLEPWQNATPVTR